jgi:NADH:ubiquinone oxidoreductase subunit 4 (chain M)
LIVIVSAFFSAIYMLYFLRNLFLEGKTEGSFLIFTDIRGIKLTVMLSLVVLMFTIGLFPFLFFNIFDASISNILHIVGMVKR